jgi:hypothetical protein
MTKYPGGQLPAATNPGGSGAVPDEDAGEVPDAGCNPDFDDCTDAGKKK